MLCISARQMQALVQRAKIGLAQDLAADLRKTGVALSDVEMGALVSVTLEKGESLSIAARKDLVRLGQLHARFGPDFEMKDSIDASVRLRFGDSGLPAWHRLNLISDLLEGRTRSIPEGF